MSIKKVTKDYGLRQHEVESFTPETTVEFERLMAAVGRMMGPDQARDHNANLIRDTLVKAGISDAFETGIADKCGPEAFHVLGAEWLRNYEWLQKCRVKIERGDASPQEVARLIDLAETLGQLKERIWWRHGVDPVTGSKRESLAVSERKSRRAIRKARPAIDAHNAEVKARADLWKRTARRIAAETWAKNSGLSAKAVAEIVRKKWPQDAGVVKAVPTIRAVLKKPDRA